MASPVDPPALGLGVDDLVDWLELTALFDEFGVARVDALAGALDQLEETAEDDIAQRDRVREELVEALENEIELRSKSGADAYPFVLNDTGDELRLVANWDDVKFAFYLVCLVTTHVTKSPILNRPPADQLLIRLRNGVFQIVATLGLAGLSGGHALSVGWPRRSGETIVELLTRAATMGAGFTARNPPGPYVAPAEKDGGIDVIAWTKEVEPPPTEFYFGQAASGKNWEGKPVAAHADVFTAAYIQDHQTGNIVCATLMPFRVIDKKVWFTQHLLHRSILDRLRLPAKAWEGLQNARNGVEMDEAGHVAQLTAWLAEYLAYAGAA